ncbi:MAG: hypothetical protein AAF961_13515, partial [Planctomycetota bacterium]
KPLSALEKELDAIDEQIVRLRNQAKLLDAQRMADALLAYYEMNDSPPRLSTSRSRPPSLNLEVPGGLSDEF